MKTEKKEIVQNQAAQGGCAVPQEADPEALVEFMLPLPGAGERQDLFVGCNGETIRIRRGESVKIKRKFLEVLEHTRQQEMADYRARCAFSQASLR